MKSTIILAFIVLALPLMAAENRGTRMDGAASNWNGFERLDFEVDGRAALLVKPKSPAPGRPWIWRMEFFGHEPQADLALLSKGWHVAYIHVENMYGAPIALDHMDKFYDRMREGFHLAPKVVLEGFSRGGLFAFNWAARHPAKVAGLYVDAPVCDFKSWPGGKGIGPGSPDDWERLLKAYGFTEAQALAYDKNPVDNLAPLAAAKIPVFAVIGDDDEIVPVRENMDLVEKRYNALGGSIEVIRKSGGRHHPHSLRDPAPIVDFALRAFNGRVLPYYDPATTPGEGNLNTAWAGFRRAWEDRQKKFAESLEADQGAIVFFGDSITEIAPLNRMFPNLHVANRGISGDTSRGMMYRLRDNVLDLNPSAVVLLCGANDMMQPGGTAKATAANVRAMCLSIHATKPDIKVYVLKIMPNQKTGLSAVREFNAAVDRAMAGLSFVIRVDTFTPFLTAEGDINGAAFYDGTHPNATGFDIYRKTLAPVLGADSK